MGLYCILTHVHNTLEKAPSCFHAKGSSLSQDRRGIGGGGGGNGDRDRRRQGRDRRETKEGEEGYRQTETGRAFSREIVERQKGKGGGERYRQTETGRAFSRETGRDRKTKEREKDTDRRRQGEHVAGRQWRQKVKGKGERYRQR